jgi:hypothetical protein
MQQHDKNNCKHIVVKSTVYGTYNEIRLSRLIKFYQHFQSENMVYSTVILSKASLLFFKYYITIQEVVQPFV